MHHSRKYYVNENYFDNWSPNMAYILGFITADGYNSYRSLTFGLNPKDIEILEFIRSEIGHNQNIKITERFDKRSQKYYQTAKLELNSVKLCNKLKNEFGILKNKTGNESICFDIPDQFKYDYIRGVFDGDGTVENYGSLNSSICSASINFLKQISIILGNLGKVIPNNSIYSLKFNRDESIKLSNMIYNNNFYLQRKYNIFCSYNLVGKSYLDSELELLRSYDGDIEKISKITGRTVQALDKKLRKLGLKKPKFNQEEISFIISNAKNMSSTQIAKILNKTRNQIKSKIRVLKKNGNI